MSSATTTAPSPAAPRRRLSPEARKLALTVHVSASVALLGTTAATMVLALRAALTDDAEVARAAYRLIQTLSLALNIPLSVTALVSGLVLGLGTAWGVFAHRWVTAKLILLIAVILIGALVVGGGVEGAVDAASAPAPGRWRIVGGAGAAAAALVASTALSVYRPGRRRRARGAG